MSTDQNLTIGLIASLGTATFKSLVAEVVKLWSLTATKMQRCRIFETVDQLGRYLPAPTMPLLFAPWWGGGFAEDEVGFHPGL
jgi:hypothetical protein